MQEIDFKTPVAIGEESAVKVRVAPLKFKRFVDITRATLQERKGKQKLEPLMLRARIRAQCTFVTSAGKTILISQEQLTALPVPAAKAIVAALPEDEGETGELLNDGNGIDSPIHYRLGSPIKGANGKKIEEIEILCKTFGDLEDVLAGDQPLYQTLDLLAAVAKPVDGSMLALPSWALDEITLADGMFILNNVLPRFLD